MKLIDKLNSIDELLEQYNEADIYSLIIYLHQALTRSREEYDRLCKSIKIDKFGNLINWETIQVKSIDDVISGKPKMIISFELFNNPTGEERND